MVDSQIVRQSESKIVSWRDSEMHLLGVLEQGASLLTTHVLTTHYLLAYLLGVVVEEDAAHVALVARRDLLEHL